MGATVSIVTVEYDKNRMVCKALCMINGISIGDSVQLYDQNELIVGVVIDKETVDVSALESPLQTMKTIIRKVVNQNQSAAKLPQYTIGITEFLKDYITLVLVEDGEVYKETFERRDFDAHNVQLYDKLCYTRSLNRHYAVVVGIIEDAYEAKSNAEIINSAHDKIINSVMDNEIAIVMYDEHSENKSAVILKHWSGNDSVAIIPEGITVIGTKAFVRADRVNRVVIRSNWLSLEKFAFSGNDHIEEIIAEVDWIRFATNAFDECKGLKRVVLPAMAYYRRDELADHYGKHIKFEYSIGKNIIEDGIVYTPDRKMIICCMNDDIEIFHTPFDVEYIRGGAFHGCRKLKKFIMSPYIKKAYNHCLEGCIGLHEVVGKFERDIDPILLFGTDYVEDAEKEVLVTAEGKNIIFYTPKSCRYVKLENIIEKLVKMKPQDMEPATAYLVAKYFEQEHRGESAIPYLLYAAQNEIQYAYQQLAIYAENEYYLRT